MRDYINNILLQLGIDVGYIEYTGKSKEYIVFSVYDEEETDKCDGTNKTDTYYITINYWFSSLKNIEKYKEIITLLKKYNFILDDIGPDNKSNGLYGKNIDFIYNKTKEIVHNDK